MSILLISNPSLSLNLTYRLLQQDQFVLYFIFFSNHLPNLIPTPNLDDIKNAIKNKDGKKLMKIFSSTKKVRKEIIKAGQDTDKPGFGRK